MQDETTPQDAKAMPPASDGSVLSVWGWVQTDWDGTEFVIPCRDQCEATRRASYGGRAVQFFPQLTDAEVMFLSRERDLMDVDDEGDRKTLEIIDGLLKRLGGER